MKKALLLVLLLCTPAWAVDAPVLNPKFWSIRIDSAGGGGVWFVTSDKDSLISLITGHHGFVVHNGADSVAITGSAIVGSTTVPTVDADTIFFVDTTGGVLDTAKLYYKHSVDSLYLYTRAGGLRQIPDGTGGAGGGGNVYINDGTSHTDLGIVIFKGTGAAGLDSLQGVTSGPTFNASTGVATFNADVNLKSSGTVDANQSLIDDVKRISADSVGDPASLGGDIKMAGRFGWVLDTAASGKDGSAYWGFFPLDTMARPGGGMPGDNWVPSYDSGAGRFVLEPQSGAGSGDDVKVDTNGSATGGLLDISSPSVVTGYGGLKAYKGVSGDLIVAPNLAYQSALESVADGTDGDSIRVKVDGSTITRGASGLVLGTVPAANIAATDGIAANQLATGSVGTLEIGTNVVSMPNDMAAFSTAEFAERVTGETGTGAVVFGTAPALSAPTITGAASIGTGATITTPTLTLKTGTAPTAEGDLQWNSTTDRMIVGDGATTKTFYPLGGAPVDSTGGTNLGAGAQIYTTKSGNNLQFRSLLTNGPITFTQNTNDITATITTGTVTSLMLQDNTIIGSDISGTAAIPWGAMSNVGAAANYVPYWTGSTWALGLPASSAASLWADTANFLYNAHAGRYKFSMGTAQLLIEDEDAVGTHFTFKPTGDDNIAGWFNGIITTGSSPAGDSIGDFTGGGDLIVTSGALEIGPSAIDNAEMADGAVTAAKIADTSNISMDQAIADTATIGKRLNIPTSATPMDDAGTSPVEGDLAWSSDADGLNTFDGTNQRFIPTLRSAQMEIIATNSIPAANDTLKMFYFSASQFPQGATLKKIYLEQDFVGSGGTWYFQEWSDNKKTASSSTGNLVLATGTESIDSICVGCDNSLADTAMAANARLICIVPTSGTTGNVHVTVEYYAKGD
jgi:hypothetical protein